MLGPIFIIIVPCFVVCIVQTDLADQMNEAAIDPKAVESIERIGERSVQRFHSSSADSLHSEKVITHFEYEAAKYFIRRFEWESIRFEDSGNTIQGDAILTRLGFGLSPLYTEDYKEKILAQGDSGFVSMMPQFTNHDPLSGGFTCIADIGR